MKTFSKIIYWLLILVAVIQFVPVDRKNKPVKKNENFVDIYHTPENIRGLLRNACYDCHSNETVYPNYAYLAPISWSIKDHINEGRERLNFSEWESFNKDLKKGMLENSASAVQNLSMPLPGYIAYHPKANLSAAQRKILENYFTEILKKGNY